MLTPLELLNVQGWPMHMPINDDDGYPKNMQNILHAIRSTPWQNIVKFAGNGMNIVIFGHVLGLAVFTTAAGQRRR